MFPQSVYKCALCNNLISSVFLILLTKWLITPKSTSLVVILHLHWAFVHHLPGGFLGSFWGGVGALGKLFFTQWRLLPLIADRVVVSRRICYFVWPKAEKTPDVHIMLTLSGHLGWMLRSFPAPQSQPNSFAVRIAADLNHFFWF